MQPLGNRGLFQAPTRRFSQPTELIPQPPASREAVLSLSHGGKRPRPSLGPCFDGLGKGLWRPPIPLLRYGCRYGIIRVPITIL